MPPHTQQLISRLVAWLVGGIGLWMTFQPQVCAYFAWSCKAHPPDLKDVSGWALLLFGSFLTLFNIWLWHTGLGRSFLFGWPVPDVRGTWKGVLTPVDAPAGVARPLAPRTVFLVVRQTAFRFRATLYTQESNSRSVAAEFSRHDDEMELVYSYQNIPDLSLQQRSPPHLGTAILEMVSTRPSEMKGYYYTQRLTRGELHFTEHCKDLAQGYQDATSMTCIVRPVRR